MVYTYDSLGAVWGAVIAIIVPFAYGVPATEILTISVALVLLAGFSIKRA